MALVQAARALRILSSPFEHDCVLTGFRGEEAISRPFRFELDLLSDNNQIDPHDVIGQPIAFCIDSATDTRRDFHGIICQFGQGDEDEHGRRAYAAVVRPWFWLLSHTRDCRIFQRLTVPQIIETVFQDFGFSDYDTTKIQGTHPRREYCVAYRESYFHFLTRLMAEEGIFWFFRHSDAKHDMVLSDMKEAYVRQDERKIDFPRDFGSRAIEEHITSWWHNYQFHTGSVAQRDFNFETPRFSLEAKEDTVVPVDAFRRFSYYDYPGGYGNTNDGRPLTRLLMEAHEATHDVVEGTSLCRHFSAGRTFQIRRHRSLSEEGQTYVLTSLYHEAQEPLPYETGRATECAYRNQFNCIPASVVYRPLPETSKPYVRGVQTATIVGPAGEEIYTDKHGRVKAQFPWDRQGKSDDGSSCWIRVSQAHASSGFGFIDIPRVGDEVVVSFEEGDPDRPLITGRVYHAENPPPFDLPGSKTKCGFKTKTYQGNGFNEYSLDDSPGAEQIVEHAQRDKKSTVQHDLDEKVLNDRRRFVKQHEEVTIGGNRNEEVKLSSSERVWISKDLTVGAAYITHVGGAMHECIVVSRSEEVFGFKTEMIGAYKSESVGHKKKMTIGRDLIEHVGRDHVVQIARNRQDSVQGTCQMHVEQNLIESVSGNHEESVKNAFKVGAKTIVLEATEKIELKCGKTTIRLTPDLLFLLSNVVNAIASDEFAAQASNLLDLSGGSFKLRSASGGGAVTASGSLDVKGQMVKINC